MTLFVDSHCHLDRIELAPFGGEFARFMAEAQARGIEAMLCVSINLEEFPAMYALVKDYAQVSISVGVHPNELGGAEATAERLASLAVTRGAVAIGETGLDFYRSQGDLGWQHDRFRTHVQAARKTKLPLIVHSRAAKEDTLRILQEEGAADVGGVLHCFTEDWDMACRAMDLNFYISFSGIVTFRNAQTLKAVAKKVPEDRLLIETDSPYLAPVPFRGKPNNPLYVHLVAEHIAALRGVSVERIAELSAGNFHTLFRSA